MVEGNSRTISSNQAGIHEDLDKVVRKHLSHEFKKPYAEFSLSLFTELADKVTDFMAQGGQGVILDSCCGIGESSFHHAKANPKHLVIGIDKSEHRLDKYEFHHGQLDNLVLARGDLNDLWRLIAQSDWPVTEHYILYPNPWPKSKHLQRRWHGAPVFSAVPKIGQTLIVRSNWDIYIKEFQQALNIAGIQAQVSEYQSDDAITPFERKYWASGQNSHQLVAVLAD